jgi:hypothetical protein
MKFLKLFEQKSYEEHVAEVCQKYKIENWLINSEGLVDVDGDVELSLYLHEYFSRSPLTKLPLNFGHVSGDFYCYNNLLTSLEGAPKSVGGFFVCSYNRLTSFEGCPQSVGGNFSCGHNSLTSLRFAPEQVEGEVFVLPNPISNIPEQYLTHECLQFIVKEQSDWNLYRKDGTRYPERLKQMIEWGIETNKIKPL